MEIVRVESRQPGVERKKAQSKAWSSAKVGCETRNGTHAWRTGPRPNYTLNGGAKRLSILTPPHPRPCIVSDVTYTGISVRTQRVFYPIESVAGIQMVDSPNGDHI